jgi:hypothetical protein
MESLIKLMIGVSLAGFAIGLAGKAVAVKKNSPSKSEFYSRISIFFLILMFLLIIVYQFIN